MGLKEIEMKSGDLKQVLSNIKKYSIYIMGVNPN